MRAEADADVERSVEMQCDRRPELVHGFTLQADEDGEGVAALFDSDALGMDACETASETILEILHEDGLVGAVGEMDHACTVLAEHGFLRIVVEVLAKDENNFAVAESVGVEERDIGRKGDVARDLLPQIAELVALVPDVVAGGNDGVLAASGIVRSAAGHQRSANVGLAVEDADGRFEGNGGAVKVRGRGYLDVGRGTGQSPIRNLRRGGGGLRGRQMWRGAEGDEEQEASAGKFVGWRNGVEFHSKEL